MECSPPIAPTPEANDAELINRFADVSPNDILAIWRYETEPGPPGYRPNLEFSGESVVSLSDDPRGYVAALPTHDLQRAHEVYGAFAESSLPKDRGQNAIFVKYLTLADHDAGVKLWDRLFRDTDEDVQWAAEFSFSELLGEAKDERLTNLIGNLTGQQYFHSHSMYAVDAVDEAKLRKSCGLTRVDAYNLMLSHAYALNQQGLHHLGEVAMLRVLGQLDPAATSEQ